MTALDKKINQLAARHRWNVTPVHDRFIPCYSIVPMDRQERDRIKATLDRCKGLKVKVEQVFSPYAWTCSIYVFDLAEWEAQQERSRREWAIVNAYSEAYHFNGHDSAGAKLAAQHKAAEIGALDLFRQMYAACTTAGHSSRVAPQSSPAPLPRQPPGDHPEHQPQRTKENEP